MIRKKIHSKFLKNTGWIIGQQIVHMLLSLIVGMLSARYLGPEKYGIINYVSSFVTIFSCISSLGMDSVVVKELIDEPKKEGEILGGGIYLRTISGLLSSLSVILVISILNPGETETIIISVLYSISLIFRSFELLDCWFQRYLASKYTSIAKIIAYLAVSCYQVILLSTSKNVFWFSFATTLNYIILAIILFIFYKKQSKYNLKVDARTGLKTLKKSYHFIISGLMVSLYSQMDKMMLKSMIGPTDVGLYSTAAYICTMWIFIPTALINSARPIIMTEKKKGEYKYIRRLEQLYSGVIWISLFVSIFVSIFGSAIISIMYGPQYEGAVGALKILIWSETFSMIGTARSVWVVSENKNKYVKYYLLYGVITNAILNYILIPRIGISGAAIATLVTQIVSSIIAPLFYKETRIHTKYVLESFVLKWYFKKERG